MLSIRLGFGAVWRRNNIKKEQEKNSKEESYVRWKWQRHYRTEKHVASSNNTQPNITLFQPKTKPLPFGFVRFSLFFFDALFTSQINVRLLLRIEVKRQIYLPFTATPVRFMLLGRSSEWEMPKGIRWTNHDFGVWEKRKKKGKKKFRIWK